MALLEQLLNTPEYQFVTAGTSVIVDFMTLTGETGFEKNPKVRDVFDSAWETILNASNSDRMKLFTISISKFQSKNWSELEEQKRNPLILST